MLKMMLLSSAALIVLGGCATEVQKTVNGDAEKHAGTDIRFVDISDEIGLTSTPTWKYGGPSVSDLDGDGVYDFLLTNHHIEPAQTFWGNADGTLREGVNIATNDVHGIAAGDFDLDGDNDVLVSLGGGNGSTPQPPRMLRNDDGVFVDITEEAGISQLGARGRSVRWVDMDLDGDLDFLQINARQVIGEDKPRNILFENLGGGKFKYRNGGAFEKTEAERVLLTDIDGDHVTDLVTFSPLAIWKGGSDFSFKDVTDDVLPKAYQHAEFISAVADADIDNDGDFDLYVARGKTYYEIANNSVSYNGETQRLDIRDEGNKSHDGISFKAGDTITLSDFSHWARGKDLTFPVFLGSNKTQLKVVNAPDSGRDGGKITTDTPSAPTKVSADKAEGFPEVFGENGWYLGYVGDGEWRMEWHLDFNLAWDIRGSISGVEKVLPDWTPQNLDVPDILLRNDGGVFSDVSAQLPAESMHNNWGVTNGDFNNDGQTDFFVYRFGELRKRVPDVLLVNQGTQGFAANISHGANVLGEGGHGDMGAAFDYDFDGAVDLLSGDDDDGKWHLYKNQLAPDEARNYTLVRVGYSPKGTDPLAAEITVTAGGNTYVRRVGSAGAVHSQSVLNIAHFGLADAAQIDGIQVRWRDGETEEISNVSANEMINVGRHGVQDKGEN
ncbi:CRTAC1 family protein [Hirschia litorea]|uniref:CRTAC1 family protein n=1 Tax=Hirschia litorea TaxID=1199156 RepID=A0ABW2IPA6_9PROT